MPPLAAGLGSLTRLRVDIGRRFRAGGVRRSYVSARCSEQTPALRGRFTFAEGTVIDGSVEKFCRGKLTPPPPDRRPAHPAAFL